MPADPDPHPQWSLDDIPYDRVRPEPVSANPLLFCLLASASFVEITSDLYTRNLLEYYEGDAEVTDWLAEGWEVEEVQHGKALRRYVETRWPEFDWEAAYRSFLAEYSHFCSLEQLAPSRPLEMAARCVVETGTSTFYRMLSDACPEPVLKQIAHLISTDEVGHYKHFYRYFLRYREREPESRRAVLRTLWNRIGEIDAEDAFLAVKHVHLASNPGADFRKRDYTNFRQGVRQLGKDHYPYDMAIKMLLKPLDLNPTLGRVVVPAMASATRLLLFRY